MQHTLNEAKSMFWQTHVSTPSCDSKVGSVWKAIKTLSGIYSNRNIPLKVLGNPILTDWTRQISSPKSFLMSVAMIIDLQTIKR